MEVLYLDLPCTVRGFTIKTDGLYTIVINARLSHEQALKTALHEKLHELRDDISRKDTYQIEKEVRELLDSHELRKVMP